MKRSKGRAGKSEKVASYQTGIGVSRSKTAIVLLVFLFLAGAVHWILFFHQGELSFKAHDWGKEFTYYSVLRNSIETGTIPFHVSQSFHGTDRFLALPEINLSPQILLLPLMSVGRFLLVNTLILYSIGFIGCLMIRKRYQLSLLPFCVLFLVFNLNGHITSHIGVGHSMWVGYFFLPMFFLFTLEVVEGKSSHTTPIKLAFVLFAMMLQGSLHIYVWCLIFLILLLLFNWKLVRPIVFAIVSSLMLSLFRFLPALSSLWGKKEKFIWSYPTLRDLIDAMVTIRQQTPERLRPWGTPGWWEYDMYIGILGLAVIAYFGIYLRIRRHPGIEGYEYKALDLPLILMSLFSISYFQAFLTRLPIPFLRAERVATRFIIIPVLLLLLISSIRMDRLLTGIKQGFKLRFAAILGLIVMALSFIDHSYLWSLPRLERVFRTRAVDLAIPGIVSRQDGLYKTLVWTSGLVSIASIAFLLYLARARRPRRERR
jgi:hypothetical protein